MQKLNSKIQILKLSKFKKKKKKKSEYSKPRNYWGKKKKTDYTAKKYRERLFTFKRIICGYSCWNILNNFKFCRKKKWKIKESDIKTLKSKKKRKNNNNRELDDLELRNYWNKTKEYMTIQQRNIRDNVLVSDVAKKKKNYKFQS